MAVDDKHLLHFIIYVIDPHYIHLKIVEKVLICHYVKLAAFKCKSEV